MVHRNSVVIGKEGIIIKLKGKKQIELFSDDNYNCYAPFYLNDALYCVREHKYSDETELFNIETKEGYYLNIITPKKIIGSSNDECFILDNNEDMYEATKKLKLGGSTITYYKENAKQAAKNCYGYITSSEASTINKKANLKGFAHFHPMKGPRRELRTKGHSFYLEGTAWK